MSWVPLMSAKGSSTSGFGAPTCAIHLSKGSKSPSARAKKTFRQLQVGWPLGSRQCENTSASCKCHHQQHNTCCAEELDCGPGCPLAPPENRRRSKLCSLAKHLQAHLLNDKGLQLSHIYVTLPANSPPGLLILQASCYDLPQKLCLEAVLRDLVLRSQKPMSPSCCRQEKLRPNALAQSVRYLCRQLGSHETKGA